MADGAALRSENACEVKTLGYPRAAWFACCVALVLQNAFSMLHGSLRSVPGGQRVDEEVSGVLRSQELQKTYEGMMVQIPAYRWQELARLTIREFATLLQRWVAKIDLSRDRKTPRGPKKPQPKRKPRSKGGRVSTAVILGTYKPPP